MHAKAPFSYPSSRLLAALMTLTAATACQKTAAPAANADLAAAQTPAAAVTLSNAAPPPLADAPPVTALPPAPPSRVSRLRNRSDAYAFADRANSVDYGFGSAPPDYAFDYNGVNPWTWQSDDGYQTVVEPLPGGGDRYYYYDPGSDEPFLVRDPDGAYGFDNGALVVVYDADGLPRSDDYLDRDSGFAGRYLYRGRALWDASRHDPHFGVSRSAWYARRGRISQEQTAWYQTRDQDQGWAAYHQQHAADEQAQWASERYRREAEAYRMDQAANDVQAAARERQAALQAAQTQRSAPGLANGGGFGPTPAGGPAGGAPRQRPARAAFNAQTQAVAPAAHQAQIAARSGRTGQQQAAHYDQHLAQRNAAAQAPAGRPVEARAAQRPAGQRQVAAQAAQAQTAGRAQQQAAAQQHAQARVQASQARAQAAQAQAAKRPQPQATAPRPAAQTSPVGPQPAQAAVARRRAAQQAAAQKAKDKKTATR